MLKHHRHELFLREYFANGWNGKEAYITVYGPVKTANVQACKLLARPKVRKRFNQMVARLIKRADITEERILSKYEEAFDMARETGKTADMISAASAQAKLVGLLRDRLEAGSPGDFEHMENASDVLAAIAERTGPEIAMQIGKALGITQQTEPQLVEESPELAEAQAASDSIN